MLYWLYCTAYRSRRWFGVFPDVRFKEPKWFGQSFDPGGIDHVSKEWALRIAGPDGVTIPRKWQSAWRGPLPMKIRLISNIIPNFNDPILPSRFVTIAYNVSFADRIDINMLSKLKAELPGIANRCLRAYHRLCKRGRFIQPKSGLVLWRKVAAQSNEYQAFADECLDIGVQGVSVKCINVFLRFKKWCAQTGQLNALKSAPSSKHLGKLLKKHVKGFTGKWFRPGDNAPREYVGVRLKAEVEFEVEDEVKVGVEDEVKEEVKEKEAVVLQIRRGFLRRF